MSRRHFPHCVPDHFPDAYAAVHNRAFLPLVVATAVPNRRKPIVTALHDGPVVNTEGLVVDRPGQGHRGTGSCQVRNRQPAGLLYPPLGIEVQPVVGIDRHGHPPLHGGPDQVVDPVRCYRRQGDEGGNNYNSTCRLLEGLLQDGPVFVGGGEPGHLLAKEPAVEGGKVRGYIDIVMLAARREHGHRFWPEAIRKCFLDCVEDVCDHKRSFLLPDCRQSVDIHSGAAITGHCDHPFRICLFVCAVREPQVNDRVGAHVQGVHHQRRQRLLFRHFLFQVGGCLQGGPPGDHSQYLPDLPAMDIS